MGEHSRLLVDQEYFQANCDKDVVAFEEDYMVDNLPWTYWTNYVIGIVSIVLALIWMTIFYQQRHRLKKNQENNDSYVQVICFKISTTTLNKMFILGYLFWSAFGYIVAGVGHQVIERRSDYRNELFKRVSYIFIDLGAACLWGEAILLFQTNSNQLMMNVRAQTFLWVVVWLITNIAVIIVTATIGNILIAGIWLLVGNAVAFVSYMFNCCNIFIQRKNINEGRLLDHQQHDAFSSVMTNTKVIKTKTTSLLMKSFAMIFSIVGLLIQVLLAGSCGYGGYEECFPNCILSNPKVFNHNALFHLFMILSFVFYGIAELQLLILLLSSSKSSEIVEDGVVVSTKEETSNNSNLSIA